MTRTVVLSPLGEGGGGGGGRWHPLLAKGGSGTQGNFSECSSEEVEGVQSYVSQPTCVGLLLRGNRACYNIARLLRHGRFWRKRKSVECAWRRPPQPCCRPCRGVWQFEALGRRRSPTFRPSCGEPPSVSETAPTPEDALTNVDER